MRYDNILLSEYMLLNLVYNDLGTKQFPMYCATRMELLHK